jgi:ferredoxin-NADP reductase
VVDYAPSIASADVFICGPQAWSDLVIADAKAAGVRAEAIHYERFSW